MSRLAIATHVISALRAVKGFSEWWDAMDADAHANIIVSIEGVVDDEESDGLDGCAHPAWWRGNDAGVDGATERIMSAIDGKDDGSGIIADPILEKARRRVLDLMRVHRILREAVITRFAGPVWVYRDWQDEWGPWKISMIDVRPHQHREVLEVK